MAASTSQNSFWNLHPSTTKANSFLRSAVIVLVSSWALALSAQVAIPLPFTPVPMTLQTLSLVLLTPLLGTSRAIAMVVTYLAQGAAGLPFFSAGRGGLSVLLSPTGGYLLGFIAAAALVGFAHEHGLLKTWFRRVCVFALSGALVLMAGTAGLASYLGWPKAIALGFLPFVAGDLVKSVFAASVWNKRLS
jgi:biotin transport system substrate-specific component